MRDKTSGDQGYRPARRQGRTSQGDSNATMHKRHHRGRSKNPKNGALGHPIGNSDDAESLSGQRGASRKIRTGLTIASIKALPNVVKCFRCHMFGHIANKCTAISPGKEICRKCGANDHTIAACVNAPCCSICSKEKGVKFDHVTGLWLVQNIEGG